MRLHGALGETLLWVVGIAMLAFLVLPLLVVVPLSFSAGTFLTFPMPGLSLRWYEELWHQAIWVTSFRNSLVVAVAATAIATLLGTSAAMGLHRASFRGKGLIMALLLSPMIVPIVIVGVGSFFFFQPLGLTSSLTGLAIAHAVLGAPFVLVTVNATLAGLDPVLARAAANLGAPPWTTFRRITLPIIAPGVISGALFAFVTSFDEVVLALFLTGPGQRTLPRQMFDGVREQITPTILAAATVLILIAILLLVTAELLRRRSLRLRGVKP